MNFSQENGENIADHDPSLADENGEPLFFEPQRGMKRETNLGDRRTPARLTQESLICNLGPVLDLSTGGMRVLCKRTPKDPLKIRLWAFQYYMNLDGQVAWSRRLGFRRHEIGLQFLNVDDETSTILSRISAIHRMRRAI